MEQPRRLLRHPQINSTIAAVESKGERLKRIAEAVSVAAEAEMRKHYPNAGALTPEQKECRGYVRSAGYVWADSLEPANASATQPTLTRNRSIAGEMDDEEEIDREREGGR